MFFCMRMLDMTLPDENLEQCSTRPKQAVEAQPFRVDKLQNEGLSMTQTLWHIPIALSTSFMGLLSFMVATDSVTAG